VPHFKVVALGNLRGSLMKTPIKKICVWGPTESHISGQLC